MVACSGGNSGLSVGVVKSISGLADWIGEVDVKGLVTTDEVSKVWMQQVVTKGDAATNKAVESVGHLDSEGSGNFERLCLELCSHTICEFSNAHAQQFDASQ